MNSNGKRDVLGSLDYLLYCDIAYTYFLDSSFLQLLSPRSYTRPLRMSLALVFTSFVLCMLLHLLSEPGQPGIIIDFIGNHHKPTKTRILLLDLTIFVFQVVRVLIASSLSSQLLLNGSVVHTVNVPGALVNALGTDRLTLMLPPLAGDHEEVDDLFYQNDLVVDVGVGTSIRNIMYGDEDPATARDGSEQLPV
ncbi:hypothetical protein K501DRAFT_196325 [Backusella circina FSU 941]|nr:hypothetical protein K501DRAFT_196325 [Backusella circina FSU 941]